MKKLPLLTFSGRFVDRDMFMHYRGGGVGHKYMQEIEAKHKNMSLERNHWYYSSKTQAQVDGMDVDTGGGGGDEGPKSTMQPGGLEDNKEEDPGSEPVGRNQEVAGNNEDEPDGDEGIPLEGGSSSDDDSGSEGAGIEGDPEELGSDAGYDSYSLADP
jgi:hypothetical protein